MQDNSQIKDSGTRREFVTGAVRDIQEGKGRYDLIPWEAIHELAIHCEQGALKYGERNVEKGIPVHSFIDSAFRHIARYMMGHRDEPHLRAAMWYIATTATTAGMPLDDIAAANVEKLKVRYPDGFSEEKSIKREA